MNVTVRRPRASIFAPSPSTLATNSVQLIEQRLLAARVQNRRRQRISAQTARAIADMVVRGAGRHRRHGRLRAGARRAGVSRRGSEEIFRPRRSRFSKRSPQARPTAVDPVNAMKRRPRGKWRAGQTVAEQQSLALAAAEEFADEDVRHCAEIGRHGAKLIRNGMRILTHCNAGWLAFVDIGSATAPLYAAQEQGKRFHVFCDETRPRSQGATLTAWELAQQKIPHHIIADNAAGHLMQRGEIDLVIVGSDRVLGRTGEVANKIGTYTKAVLAARHKIPFYVAIPLSTIDWTLAARLGHSH